MITTEEFERWWNQEGSAINPTAFEDTSEHVKRVSEIAWANGHYMATVTNLKSQQWQPIETAPKDGYNVLLCDVRGRIHIGSFRTDLNDEDGEPLWLANDHNDYSCGLASTPISATHWMPLPAPPMSDK